MTNDAHVDDLIDLYALGVLEPAEHSAVEQHLEQCAACRAEFARSAQVVELLAWTPAQHEPPAGGYERLIARIERAQPRPAPQQRGLGARLREWLAPQRGLRLGFAMALILALGLGGWNLALRRQLRDSEAAVALLQTEAQQTRQLAALLAAPGTELVPLSAADPPGSGAAARGQLVLNRERGAAYFAADGFAALPADRAYQLWFITDEAPVSAGVFRVDAQGRVFMAAGATLPPGARAAGVTVEPAAGSAQPTTPPFLIGQF